MWDAGNMWKLLRVAAWVVKVYGGDVYISSGNANNGDTEGTYESQSRHKHSAHSSAAVNRDMSTKCIIETNMLIM